ncbi:MAG TPA: nucleotidyltransferase domain-containing protein [Pilimelia sp.]|nr:nucleotidyltransferase domain-containing protein [Pilimelia sp.]
MTWLEPLAARLGTVTGVVAVSLGGSRARGTARPDSDWDLGVYYEPPLDVAALRSVAGDVADRDAPATVTAPGEWGRWVDGGAWLTVGGRRVDLVYREYDRVAAVWEDCRRGRYELGFQVGHPLGYYSHTYAGEVATCRILHDPGGLLGALRTETEHYPAPLGDALVAGLWEAGFVIDNAAKVAPAGDGAYVSGCLFRAVGVLAHALHGHARRWLVGEKGMLAASSALANAPAQFATRAGALLGAAGLGPAELEATLAAAADLVAETREAVARE